jgi:Ca-activated chloride channel homolog
VGSTPSTGMRVNQISARPSIAIHPLALLRVVALTLCFSGELFAQLPFINAGPDSAFAQIDFAQIYLDTANREHKKNEEQVSQRKHMVEIGAVSALDLEASEKAIAEYNQAATLMKAQNMNQAIVHLRKAIAAYPKFVLAHNTLGLAYLDQQDSHAKEEFETAARLDPKFPGTFLNLGMLALSTNDFANAESALQRAAALNPKDPKSLAALAFAQNGDHKYAETLKTVELVHAMDHRGMANVHYVAAAAALSLGDYDTVQKQLTLLLAEDPHNPLAPVAHKNLDALAKRAVTVTPVASLGQSSVTSGSHDQTFPNSSRLNAQLDEMQSEPDADACTGCGSSPDQSRSAPETTIARASSAEIPAPARSNAFRIHQTVDETALFFAVSHRGHMIDDLTLSDIRIRDDEKPPDRILEFLPQSKLPLRLGLLIDTSGSIQDRFSFEKRAAEKFLERVLNQKIDLAFVAGFNSDISVTQDFAAEPELLSKGVEKLTIGGGTSVFDAVSFACWKLAAYPEGSPVAKVLLILSDGEDNSSHRSLKQIVREAETTGVTIYAVSTSDSVRPETSADRILDVMAERSGGEAFFPGDLHTLDEQLGKVRDLIRSRYLIAYKPADFVRNGRYRSIRISAERNGKHLQVHARKGYYAPGVTAPN